MGSSLRVYLVDLGEIGNVIGSKSDAIARGIEEQFCDPMDDDEDPMNREEMEPGIPTLREALNDVMTIPMDELTEKFGAQHARVLEFICHVQSEFLGEVGDHWMSQADDILRARKVHSSASFRKLWQRPPFGINEDKYGGGIGYISNYEACSALKILRPLNILGVSKDVAFYIIQFYGWLERAEQKGEDLIGFYS